MFTFKTEESSSLSLDEDEDEDNDDKDNGAEGWLACLLCGKPNDDLPSPIERHNKDEPYLCASCSQRFELIQNGSAGEVAANGDAEESSPNIRAIVKLEETEEELKVLGLAPKLRSAPRGAWKAASRTSTPSAADADGEGEGAGSSPECAECNVKFEDAAALERHAMTHMAAHALMHGDVLAGAGGVLEDQDQDGDGEREERPTPFKCEVCTRGFSRKDKLKLHLMIHSGDKPLKCEACGKAFLRRDHLKNHMRTHSRPRAAPKPKNHGRKVALAAADPDGDAEKDKVERPFGCEVCHKMFTRKDNLGAHMRIHTGERPFACDLCEKRFAEKCALKRHMVVHTQERLYLCGVCGRSFARKGHLTEHVWLHDEVKPFSCSVCGKAFARDRKLKSHMMTHSGERPFKCNLCDRAFARKDNLRSHQSLHLGIRFSRSRQGDGGEDEDGVEDGVADVADASMQVQQVQDAAMQGLAGLAVPQQGLEHQLMAPMGVGHVSVGHVGVGHLGVGHLGVGHLGTGAVAMAPVSSAMVPPGVVLGMGGMGMVPS